MKFLRIFSLLFYKFLYLFCILSNSFPFRSLAITLTCPFFFNWTDDHLLHLNKFSNSFQDKLKNHIPSDQKNISYFVFILQHIFIYRIPTYVFVRYFSIYVYFSQYPNNLLIYQYFFRSHILIIMVMSKKPLLKIYTLLHQFQIICHGIR